MDPSSPAAIPIDARWNRDRAVPLLLKVRVTLGSPAALFGTLFIAFGSIFLWVFDVPGSVRELIPQTGARAVAECSVSYSHMTRVSIGGSKGSRGTPVWRHTIDVTTTSGKHGVAYRYTTGGGSQVGLAPHCAVYGDDPASADVAGMRVSVIGWVGLLLAAFALAGVVAFVVGIIKGIGNTRLLATGRAAFGKLIEKRPTNTTINKQRVYEYVFEFHTDQGERHLAKVRTHQPARIIDETHEPLLYDPVHPKRAVLLDGLPGNPRPNAAGDFESPAGSWWLVLLPYAGLVIENVVLAQLTRM
jgi:hypothetical protein